MDEQVKSCETCALPPGCITEQEHRFCNGKYYQPKEQKEVMPLVDDEDELDGQDMDGILRVQRDADQKWHEDKLEDAKREWGEATEKLLKESLATAANNSNKVLEAQKREWAKKEITSLKEMIDNTKFSPLERLTMIRGYIVSELRKEAGE